MDSDRFLSDVDPAKVFRTCNGVVLRNLSELASYLDGCSEYDFTYHVNFVHGKNDFAIWVREVIGDNHLSDTLDSTVEKDRYVHAVKQRIRELSQNE